MRPVEGAPVVTVEADALVRDGLDRIIDCEGPVGVVENGALVGQLTRDDVLRGLRPRTGD